MGSGDKWCRHRTAFDKDKHPVCEVGVDYHGFKYGNHPCLGEGANPLTVCPKFSPYTKAELKAREERFTKRLERIGMIRSAIIADIGNASTSGTIGCPACKTGIVRFSRPNK